MYGNYQAKNYYFLFVKETLKDCLCDTLKELKTKNFND
jgi:hypothetical protein